MSISYADLKPGMRVKGFEARAMYRNSLGQAMGGRFVHEASGFVLDLIEIQTVPQSYVEVNTPPVSNMGEPHTQEHLLLGKGNVGRAVAARETMSMVESTAFTQQLKTCYPFAANAGVASYFEHFERSMHALLEPDYTDEEIRREVRHFGVNAQGELEEKGTIYTEMMSSAAQPGYKAYRAMGRLLLGLEHPMSYDSGGDPKYIREMQPEDIRRFHARNYHLANMRMITSLPKGLELEGEVLGRFDAILTKLQGAKPVRAGWSWAELPEPQPAPVGTVEIVKFPAKNPAQPGPAQIAWPMTARMGVKDEALADLFVQAFGGDPTTNLYKLFIDSKTRRTDVGARSVAMGFDNEAYAHFYVYIPDLAAEQATAERLREIAGMVKGELERVAAFGDGSEELRELHERMAGILVRTKRSVDKLMSSPPGFGARMSQSIWPNLLRDLNEEEGFEKDLLQQELFAYLEGVLAGDVNVWKEKIAEWRLCTVEPYAVAAKASVEMIAEEEADQAARLAAEGERLKTAYGVGDVAAAIARYKDEYDAATAELERIQSMDTPARFIDEPPLTLDDQLDAVVSEVGGVRLVTGRFDGMGSATVGLALSVREWSREQYVYASLLPQLLSSVGVVKDGAALSYEEMIQRMRREILGVGAAYGSNPTTGRLELSLTAAGNTLEETQAAIGWLKAILWAPNWAAENLSRIRDVVAQSINALRGTMQRSEEHWVQGPAMAWTYQADALYVSVSSFHAQLHHLHRLKWRLAQGPVTELAAALEGVGPEDLKVLEAVGEVGAELARDLAYLASELPENSRATDWAQLVEATRADLLMRAEDVLEELEQARRMVMKRGNARLHVTASPENAAAIEPLLEELVAGLADAPVEKSGERRERGVARRVMERCGLAEVPQFVGLLAPSMNGGVHLHSVPGVTVKDVDEEAGLQFLAFRLFTGGGPHGIFMKTWAAGLAYSNGLRASAFEGRSHYYAERTPLLPQTVKFVVNELKAAPRDKSLKEYALAQVFAGTRAGGSFESRTSALAADLADDWGPEVVKAFRQNLLRLRQRPELDAELYARMDAMYGAVLPGYSDGLKRGEASTFYVIGPDKQIAAWEEYVGEPVVRLYPRDYWVVVE
jgi:hypothetical protein